MLVMCSKDLLSIVIALLRIAVDSAHAGQASRRRPAGVQGKKGVSSRVKSMQLQSCAASVRIDCRLGMRELTAPWYSKKLVHLSFYV